jgi:hypothetical protein
LAAQGNLLKNAAKEHWLGVRSSTEILEPVHVTIEVSKKFSAIPVSARLQEAKSPVLGTTGGHLNRTLQAASGP